MILELRGGLTRLECESLSNQRPILSLIGEPLDPFKRISSYDFNQYSRNILVQKELDSAEIKSLIGFLQTALENSLEWDKMLNKGVK